MHNKRNDEMCPRPGENVLQTHTKYKFLLKFFFSLGNPYIFHDLFLKAIFFMIVWEPSRSTEYVSISGGDKYFPLTFVATRWVEFCYVAERTVLCT